MADKLNFNPIPFEEMVPELTVQRFVRDELSSTSYRPTIIIGLGGTGLHFVRRVMKQIRRHFEPEEREIFQFLVFDTAAEEVPEGVEPLDPGDFVYLPAFDAADMIRHLDENPYIAAWWPGGLKRPYRPSFSGTGAKRVRAVGRLVLFNYISDLIMPRISAKIDRAIEVNAQHGMGATSIKFYIVASTAGGTGSSMVLDIAYNARMLALERQPTAYVTGVLVTDDAFTSKARTANTSAHFSANTYALLKEINHFSKTRTFHVRYNDMHTTERLPEGAFRPFDVCYLLGLHNTEGQALDSFDSLADMGSAEVFLEIASRMQDAASNRLDNVHANEWSVSGQPTAFSSFALSSLVYPIHGIASWCALRTHAEFSRGVLLSPMTPANQVESEVLAFTQAAQIEEEQADQLIERLITDDKGERRLPPTVSHDQVNGVPEIQLIGMLQRLEEQALGELAVLRELIIANVKPIENNFRGQLVTQVETLLRDSLRGPRYLTWFLDTLVQRMTRQRDESMLGEQALYNMEVAAYEAAWQAAKAQISKVLRMTRLHPLRGQRLRNARQAYATSLNAYLNARVEQERRTQAARCFEVFLKMARDNARAANELVRSWEQQAEASAERAELATSRRRALEAEYSLMRNIVSPEAIQRIYYEHKPDWSEATQQRYLADQFWQFVARRAPAWGLMRVYQPYEQPVHLSVQVYYFLFELYVQQLQGKDLIDRLREIHGQNWKREIELRHKQTAPFWNYNLARHGDQLRNNLQNEPQLVGFGGNGASDWTKMVSQAIGEPIDGVNTKNVHELIFLKTSHGLPLFALRSVPTMREKYLLMKKRWDQAETGSNPVPVHASSEWERIIEDLEPKNNHRLAGAASSTNQGSGATPSAEPNGHGVARTSELSSD